MERGSTLVPCYKTTPSAMKKWHYKRGDFSFVIFYYLSAFDIWPVKSGSLWWEWPYEKGTTVVTERGKGLWFEEV